jgi:hypothetical protein
MAAMDVVGYVIVGSVYHTKTSGAQPPKGARCLPLQGFNCTHLYARVNPPSKLSIMVNILYVIQVI